MCGFYHEPELRNTRSCPTCVMPGQVDIDVDIDLDGLLARTLGQAMVSVSCLIGSSLFARP